MAGHALSHIECHTQAAAGVADFGKDAKEGRTREKVRPYRANTAFIYALIGVDGDASVRGEARIAVDNYPSIAPWNASPLTIGAQPEGRNPFSGDIDRVRIYNQALAREEKIPMGRS